MSEHPKTSPPAQAPPSHIHTNRLIDSTSPYLLQHAHNPVDWYPWGEEAIERSRRENKPIFLSIGYAACHWCHVMERECFENPAIAAVMNEHFVNIKVDREERPDLDELYMLATQLMTGSGGWPMSVWLTPALEPFYAGTYFPPEDGMGRPGFPRLLLALSDAWKNRRGDLMAQSTRVVEAIRLHADESGGKQGGGAEQAAKGGRLGPWLRLAIEQLSDRFDPVNGGLGSAPKFPPHQALQLWLALLGSEDLPAGVLSAQDRQIVAGQAVKTLDGMARGGIFDHVAGGFARYSTDERWLVPHFEKMLYDNAQLAAVYAAGSVVLQNGDYARVARETLDFFLREMQSPLGAFFSSLDADSEGAEGRYYVWTQDDIREAAPSPEAAGALLAYFGVTPEGNWHESPVEGGSVLSIVDDGALQRAGMSPHDLRKALLHLRAFRDRRPRPGLDDKILTSWNGLMVSALAIAGRVLREPTYLEAAHRLIGFLLKHHMEGGRRLLRSGRNGHAHTDAFLDDHAYLLNGLMDLIDSTTPTSLPGTMARKRALELADTLIREFEDPVRGGFFFTSERHQQLFARMKNAADNATPAANAVAIRALLRLARVSGKEQYRAVALRAVDAFAEHIARRPEYFPTILLALLEEQAVPRAGLAAGATGGGYAVTAPATLPEDHGTGLMTVSATAAAGARAGEAFEVILRVKVAEGYHLQPAEPSDAEAFKTIARLRAPGSDVAIDSQEWSYPPSEAGGYAGTVEFRAQCRLDAETKPGTYTLRASVLAQVCSQGSCYPPDRVSVDFQVVVKR